MNELKKIDLAPVWILHRYPYRETSFIVEALSRDLGRIGLVARGARRRWHSGALLAPFALLTVNYRRRGELGSLVGAESTGPTYAFHGTVFFAACYLNELVLRFLPRDDPAPGVYALYSQALAELASQPSPAPAVRRFEGRLLRELGFASAFDRDRGGKRVRAEDFYRYDPRNGIVPASDGEALSGSLLTAIAAEQFEDPKVLASAGEVFRRLIAYHLGGRPLKTLQVARAAAREPWRSEHSR